MNTHSKKSSSSSSLVPFVVLLPLARERSLRRRDRRVRVRRLALGARRAARGAVGRAPREGNAPALRDRRVVLPAREPPPRGDRGAFRPAAPPASHGVGDVAPRVSGDRLRPQARLHVLPARGGAPLRRRSRPAATSSSSPRARTTPSRTRTGTGPTSTSSSCARPRPRASRTATGPASRPSRARETAGGSRATGSASRSRFARASSSTRRAATRRSRRRSAAGTPRRRACRRRRGCSRTSRTCARLDSMRDFAGFAAPPYPVDDAAVHHVFPGGWIWVLQLLERDHERGRRGRGRRSRAICASRRASPRGSASWRAFPSVRAQFAEARAALPFVHAPRLGFRRARAAGDGWALLPSAAAFADPILSTGFPLALLGIQRLGLALAGDWGTPRFGARVADVRRGHARGGRRGRAPRRRALRDVRRLPALRGALEALLRGGELLGVGAPPREGPPRELVPALEKPALRARAAADLRRGPRAARPGRARAPPRGRRAHDRARSTSRASSTPRAATGSRWRRTTSRRAAPKLGATPDEIERLLAASGFAG